MYEASATNTKPLIFWFEEVENTSMWSLHKTKAFKKLGGPDNPQWARLVWESHRGPILVEEMDEAWLRNAIRFAEKQGRRFFPALPAMRERLKKLEEAKERSVEESNP